MDYREKYLKYKNKYLKLKYGGDNAYVNNQYRDFSVLKSTEKPEIKNQFQVRDFSGLKSTDKPKINNNLQFRDFSGLKPIKNYYINIKLKSDFFSKELARKLDENGFHKIEKNNPSDKYEKVNAEIIFVYNHDRWPVKQINESHADFKIRIDRYLGQFPNVEWVDSIWGDYKEVITYKLNFHKRFGIELNKYLAPWKGIEYINKHEINDLDISKVSFSENPRKIIKANNGYKRFGTKVFEKTDTFGDEQLRQGIRENINYFNDDLLRDVPVSETQGEPLKPNGWIVEDYIDTDKTKDNRSFFIRVHILVVCRRGNRNPYGKSENTVYISKRQPYLIMKDTDECRHNPELYDCVDDKEGSHVINIIGGNRGRVIDENNKEVLFKFEKNPSWPDLTPDKLVNNNSPYKIYNETVYTSSDIKSINNQILDIVRIVFNKKYIEDIRPNYNSLNAYEIFGLDISFKNKNVILHEINRRTGLTLIAPFIDDLVSLMNNKLPTKEFDLLTY